MIAFLTAFAVIGSTSAFHHHAMGKAALQGKPEGAGGGGNGGGNGGGGDSTSTGCPATTVTCASEHSVKVKGGKNPVYDTVTAGEVCAALQGTCNDNDGVGLSVDEQCAVTGSISCDTILGNAFNCDTLTNYFGDVACQDSWFGGTTAKHSIQGKPEKDTEGGGGGGGGNGGGDSPTDPTCDATTVTCAEVGIYCTAQGGTCSGDGLSLAADCTVTGSLSCYESGSNILTCAAVESYLPSGAPECQDSWFGGTTAKHSIQGKPEKDTEGGGGGGGGGGKGGGGGGGEEPSEPVTCTAGVIDCGSCVTVTEKVKGQTVTVEHCAGQYCQDVLSGTCSGSLYLNADCTVTVTQPLACTATLYGISANVFSCDVADLADFLPEGTCDPSWFA